MAEGYHDFTAGEVLTAANLEDYTERQAVMRFADTTARDAALTAGIKTEGMYAVDKANNEITVYDGSAWQPMGRYGAWQTWTPTLTQSGAVTKTVTYASYVQIGKLIIAQCRLDVTGSGTSSNSIVVGLPVTAVRSGSLAFGVGEFGFWDASASQLFIGQARLISTTTIDAFRDSAGNSIGSSTPTVALASGDVITISVIYEAA